jgi:glycosyltransferase involved in cell wall biosynthesis
MTSARGSAEEIGALPRAIPSTKTGGPPLSVTIVAKNEERTIADMLAPAAELADEIVFLDSGSTDRTTEIAQRFGVHLYHQPWLGYSEQKNKALDLASGEWILSLDADEVMTAALVAEIRKTLRAGVPADIGGFRIPRVLFIGNTPVRRGGFYPDAQLRLIRKGRGRFRSRIVHESIVVDGRVGQLKNDLLHYAYKDVEQFAQTMDQYARLSAQHYFEQQHSRWRSNPLNEVLHPLWTLFYRQIVRGGLLGGPLCWRLNWIYADYVRKKVLYLRQLERSRNPER